MSKIIKIMFKKAFLMHKTVRNRLKLLPKLYLLLFRQETSICKSTTTSQHPKPHHSSSPLLAYLVHQVLELDEVRCCEGVRARQPANHCHRQEPRRSRMREAGTATARRRAAPWSFSHHPRPICSAVTKRTRATGES